MRAFDGALAFIPGGSTGIGRAVAERLAARGADVAIFARRQAPLEQAAVAIAARRVRPDQRVVWRQCDVADPDATAAVLSAAIAELGTPDLLINCAGRAVPDYVERIGTAQLVETLRINVAGTWNALQVVLPHMRARRSGHVVNVSSLSADAVAAALLDGIARRRFLIIPGREARFAHLMKRLFPALVTRVMDRQVARAAR
jgi:NADP-dependent 3-hydroxy acid dehydrogenase YdfG